MEKDMVQAKLVELGAFIADGHFVYNSGMHGSWYVNKDALFAHPHEVSEIAKLMAEPFRNFNVDVVIGPVIGGALLAQWVAYHLTSQEQGGHKVKAAFAEKSEGGFVIKRGYDKIINGANVLVVEDILTTGKSARLVVEAVHENGGTVLGVAALLNRGDVTSQDLGVPRLDCLTALNLKMFPADECPYCAQGIPVRTDLGKGAEFLAQQAAT